MFDPTVSDPGTPRPPPSMPALIAAASLSSLAISLFLPSLPTMAAYFGTSGGVMQLSVSLYLVTAAVVQLLVGPVSDRIGRRPVLLGCFVIFILGSLVCVLATRVELFLLGRILQASAAGGLVLSRAIVRDSFDAAGSASVLGYVTMGIAIGPVIAPTLGGGFHSVFGWQSNFVLMLVLGLLVLGLSWSHIHETNRPTGGPAPSQRAQFATLLGSAEFWWLNLTAALTLGTYYTFLGGGPFVAARVYGLSPATYGVLSTVVAPGYLIGNYLSGRFARSMGINRMVFAGVLVATLGMALVFVLGWIMGLTTALFFSPIFILGLGAGMTLPGLMAGIASVVPGAAGAALGLAGSLQMMGGASFAALGGWTATHFDTAYALLDVILVAAAVSVGTAALGIRARIAHQRVRARIAHQRE